MQPILCSSLSVVRPRGESVSTGSSATLRLSQGLRTTDPPLGRLALRRFVSSFHHSIPSPRLDRFVSRSGFLHSRCQPQRPHQWQQSSLQDTLSTKMVQFGRSLSQRGRSWPRTTLCLTQLNSTRSTRNSRSVCLR